MGGRNARAVQISSGDGSYEKLKAIPGAFYFTRLEGDSEPAGIVHSCPCGCGIVSSCWFKGKRPGGAEWDRSGPDDAMTLTPSIGIHPQTSPVVQGQFHWHGFLRNGAFEEC